ncbi:helix-turn-helix domain-containing protein [Paenibacillus sp. 19GGS1-52]|uniref:helix-turn-helix domain-containing protein n=1 Tax=Paenibacillus sp. 19GGS1-52 TaxID=2758563 RepID=UPI001EFB3C83|nr:helix-turn-helix domain-containing protein [Paenibacillus sp. 19GGS1-52]ULO05164.1 helix-turn-helix domain-containing protein [Paenibacillus sp. 19GGS1-52]
MRNQRARRSTSTVIIQQAPPAAYQMPELMERKPEFDPQQFMQQLGQMVIQQQTQQPRPQTLDVKEAAEYLRISAWSVYDMCRTKSLPFFKIRSRIFFRRHELEKWISENTNQCGMER